MGTKLGAADSFKLRGYEVGGLVLSCFFFADANDGNVEGVEPGEGDPLVIPTGTEYGTRLFTEGKFMGTMHGAVDRRKLRSYKGAEMVT